MAGADHTIATWRKSSYSGGNGSECVEVAPASPVVLIRDTANRAGTVLEFAHAAWRTFAAGLKATLRA
jgi:hypothetical protein